MVQFITKPNYRESILIFGDGDEAILNTVSISHKEGFMYFEFRPTPQMRWRKQIMNQDFDPTDRWIKRIYRVDLCIQLSFDFDFPIWLVLCNYYGDDNTQLYHQFVHVKQYIQRNRDLERENRTLRTTINRVRIDQRIQSERPKEFEREKLNFAKWVGEIKPTPSQQQQITTPQGESS